VICSDATTLLAALRGKFFRRGSLGGISLIQTGHILGSVALSIPGDFLYTGDFNDRSRPFLNGFVPPQAKTVVTEATYGSEEFIFGDEGPTVAEAADKIRELLNLGKSVILMGYPLGKSQHLQMLFDQHVGGFRSYSWSSVERYNDIYRLFGMTISKKEEITAENTAELLEGSALVLYMPSYAKRLPLFNELKRRGAVSIAFSGWSTSDWYSDIVGADYSFTISDHADFEGLIRTVEKTNPEKVYVVHGFTSSLAKALRRRGIDASQMVKAGDRISRFFD